MRTLHRYLLRQVAGSLLLSMAVFTTVLMLASGMKDLLRQLITGQVPAMVVLKAFGLLAPYVITFSLPMGLLASVLLVFGRFSADQEYTAARAGGVSLMAMVAPLLVVGILLSGLAAYVNLEIAPRCKQMSKTLVHEMVMKYLTTQPTRLLKEKEFITEIPDYLIHIGEQQPAGDTEGEIKLKDVLIHQFQGGQLTQRIRAARGRARVNEKEGKYVFDLIDVEVQSREPEKPDPDTGNPGGMGRWYTFSVGELSSEVPYGQPKKKARRLKDNELNFNELWRHWQARGRVVAIVKETDAEIKDLKLTDEQKKKIQSLQKEMRGKLAILEYEGTSPVFPATDTKLQVLRKGRRVGEVRTTASLKTDRYLSSEVTEGELKPGDEVRDVGKQVHLHGQFAFSCACLGFMMVGIPLGLQTSRRETTVGIAVSILLVMVFYSFLLLGRALVDKPEWHPEWIVWFPAFLFQGMGAVMLWRANRT